jgi:serine/threonine protein kinase/tetratricopeptide (TPR) repeat protein
MKECPSCRRCYDDISNFCPIDGLGLAYGIVGPRLLGGKYRLERLIARGGMGAIYQAVQEGLARLTAIKVLNPEFVNNPLALERFRREALAIAGLRHPNIVTIYDFGVTPTGCSYIAMEYLKGKPLSRIIEQEGKLSIERTLTIIEPICHALAEAHTKGVIHRDLKPDNIMLEKVGETEIVKVVDFGLAKLKQRAESRRITGSLVIGTFDYMSPEQCQSHELDATSDVYSLGIVIYEMLTGQVPFRGSSRLATIYQQINDPPRPPRALAPEIPDEVEQVILKALSKDPRDRQVSATALFQELEEASRAATVASSVSERNDPLREDTGRLNRRDEQRKSLNATLKKHLVFERFLGRERELNRLTTEFAFIRSGRAKPIIVLGDAGLGKTQLILEFRRRLGEEAALFLTGRFFDYLGSTPHKPLLDALTSQLRQISLEPELFGKIFGELSTRAREDLENNWQLWPGEKSNSGSLQGGPEGEKYRIFEYLTQLYIKLARHQPIMLWMDDMQWADGLSLNFLAYLLRRTIGEPIQFIFTARLQDVTQKDHPFQQWQSLVSASRNIEQLTLGGLTHSEIEQYLHLVFTDIELFDGAVDRLWRETQGNPYFLGEILRLLVEEDQILWTGQRWRWEKTSDILLPSSIINIVDAHLRRFREAELDVFMQAAVLGERFSFEALRLITELDEDRLIEIIETGLAGYVFKEHPVTDFGFRTADYTPTNPQIFYSTFLNNQGPDDFYSFYQTTVRKVLYSKINARRRRRLHQRVAESLEQLHKDQPERFAPLLAYHYYHGEQYQLAFKYSVKAAVSAWSSLAIDEAEKYLLRIEELLSHLGEIRTLEREAKTKAPQPLTGEAERLLAVPLAQYRILKGELLTVRGLYEEAERSLFVALKLSERVGEPEITGRAVLAAGDLCKERRDQERALKFFQHAYAVYQKAGYSAGECQALSRVAWVNYEQGNYGQASEFARLCSALAIRDGDRLAEAGAQLILASTDYRTAHYSSSMEAAKGVLRLAQPAGDRILERQAAGLLGLNSSALGLYNQALTWLDQALQIARETGTRRAEACLLVDLGEVYRRQVKFQEAIDYFTQAYEVAREIRATREQEMALLHLGLVYKGLNYHEQALGYFRQARALSREVDDPILIAHEEAGLAELHLLSGEKSEALSLSEQGLEIVRRIGLRAEQWQLLYLQGRIHREAGEQQRAIKCLQESANVLKAVCAEITDAAARKSFLSDKNFVLQLLEQVVNNKGT